MMHTAYKLVWVLCTLIVTVLAADVGFDFDGAIEGYVEAVCAELYHSVD